MLKNQQLHHPLYPPSAAGKKIKCAAISICYVSQSRQTHKQSTWMVFGAFFVFSYLTETKNSQKQCASDHTMLKSDEKINATTHQRAS